MVDLTTLEGADTPGQVAGLRAKARQPDPTDLAVPPAAAVCVDPDPVASPGRSQRGWSARTRVRRIRTGPPAAVLRRRALTARSSRSEPRTLRCKRHSRPVLRAAADADPPGTLRSSVRWLHVRPIQVGETAGVLPASFLVGRLRRR